jgi:hypothetical protein
VEDAGWVPEPVWTQWRREKSCTGENRTRASGYTDPAVSTPYFLNLLSVNFTTLEIIKLNGFYENIFDLTYSLIKNNFPKTFLVNKRQEKRKFLMTLD